MRSERPPPRCHERAGRSAAAAVRRCLRRSVASPRARAPDRLCAAVPCCLGAPASEAACSARWTRGAVWAHASASRCRSRPLTAGRPSSRRRPDHAAHPASVEKLYMTATALLRARAATPDIVTRVMRPATVDGRVACDGDLYLVGGGDPTARPRRVRRLARARRACGRASTRAAARFSATTRASTRCAAARGPAARYDRDIGGVLGALTVGRGFSTAARGTGARAPRALVRALRAEGVDVRGPHGYRRRAGRRAQRGARRARRR